MYKTSKDFFKILVSTAVAVALSLGASAAVAMGLQVSPISIELPDNKNATELWLINSSAKPVQAQVRVYQWDQKNNDNALMPTADLIVSPPVAKIAANSRQLVRVMRPKNNNNPVKLATFRIMVNELPVSSTKNAGVDFVIEYSVPVFVYTKSSPESLRPRLAFALSAKGKDSTLQVSNSGDLYAKLYAMTFVDQKGKRTDLNPGLVGYVLPHRQMTWDIGKPVSIFSSGGTLELLLNDEKHSETIAPFNH